MKKRGIINDRLSLALAQLGHGDWIVVADAGLPIPREVPRIDLALVLGVPSFREVVQAIAGELVIQRLLVAAEMRDKNPEARRFLQEQFPDVPLEEVPHAEFKELVRRAKAVVRTGEATPYANVILEAGVVF